MFFIGVKISCYTSLIAQKRENGGILGGYDVIGGPSGIGRENFEKVIFRQNFYFEKILYFGQNLSIVALKMLKNVKIGLL